jgi:SAM-dependent methyltransferase
MACNNEVVAIEPNADILKQRFRENHYTQIHGSIDELKALDDKSFDVVMCHCVLEYIDDKSEVIKEFKRVLKPNGELSIVKHNRAGRVMQMVVLLNEFERANKLLDGNNGSSADYGAIQYYNDDDIENWVDGLKLVTLTGLRCFWHLQQNQEIHNDTEWQENMLAIEKRVSTIPEYIDVAMFHHLIYKKS